MMKKIKILLNQIIPNELIKLIRRTEIEDKSSPMIFNKLGEQMKMLFLSSDETAHSPYSLIAGRYPKNILWDRYNYALDTHFYTSSNIFDIKNISAKKYAVLLESQVIIPHIYSKAQREISYLNDNFVKVFTYSPELLDKLSIAEFIPAGGVWYGTDLWGGASVEVSDKNKLISIVASNKSMCRMHVFRKQIAKHLILNDNVDVMGKVVNKYVSCEDIYRDYMYSIAIENTIEPFYFTEKILNCFASKTIPIYIGATRIGDFFNSDGIIQIESLSIEAIDRTLKQCSTEDYLSRREAIEDNFYRVKKYLCTEDFIINKHPEILL